MDNLLSHFQIPGIECGRRGSPRRITDLGIYHIALTRQIVLELNTTVESAVELAQSLMRAENAELQVFRGLSLRFDRQKFEATVDLRIADAVETIVPARRGRPPSRPSAPA